MKKPAFRHIVLLLAAAGILGPFGCSKPKEEKGKKSGKKLEPRGRLKVAPCPAEDKNNIVSEVRSVKITKCQMYDKIHQLSPYIRRRYATLQRKKEFLDRMIRFELLAGEALRQGLDKHRDVLRAKKEVMVQKLTRQLFRDSFKPADVTESELRDFYEKHKGDYNKPAMVRVSHILLKTKGEAEKLLEEAKKLDHRSFRKLARERSADETTKMRGGDLRYFPQDATHLPKPLVDAAFKQTKVGDTTGPIKSGKGWHIIRLTGRRRPITRQFHQVKQLLKNRILRKKRAEAQQKFVEGLKAKTKPFELHEDKIAQVKICKGGRGRPGHRHGRFRMPPRRMAPGKGRMGRRVRMPRKGRTPKKAK
jgi:peptidyl-prolyl cis-trans isomerase C